MLESLNYGDICRHKLQDAEARRKAWDIHFMSNVTTLYNTRLQQTPFAFKRKVLHVFCESASRPDSLIASHGFVVCSDLVSHLPCFFGSLFRQPGSVPRIPLGLLLGGFDTGFGEALLPQSSAVLTFLLKGKSRGIDLRDVASVEEVLQIRGPVGSILKQRVGDLATMAVGGPLVDLNGDGGTKGRIVHGPNAGW